MVEFFFEFWNLAPLSSVVQPVSTGYYATWELCVAASGFGELQERLGIVVAGVVCRGFAPFCDACEPLDVVLDTCGTGYYATKGGVWLTLCFDKLLERLGTVLCCSWSGIAPTLMRLCRWFCARLF